MQFKESLSYMMRNQKFVEANSPKWYRVAPQIQGTKKLDKGAEIFVPRVCMQRDKHPLQTVANPQTPWLGGGGGRGALKKNI